MDIYKQIETEVLLRNNSPIADFENLSPSSFHYILYDTYNENSPVHFQNNIENETLDRVPLFRVAEDFLRIIEREKFIKLTPLGALPKKVIVELYDKKYIYDLLIESGITKLWKEQDCIAILSTKIVTEIAGITKKASNKMTLTKKGTSFLKLENRQVFFELFLSTFADKFNWGFNDNYPEKPIGQIGWTFSIYLLEKYGKEFQSDSFYAEKYLKALPNLVNQFETDGLRTQREKFIDCYGIRTFERFLEWFGLVETKSETKKKWSEELHIKPTEILTKVFKIDTD
jgi:hypothetical protein